MKKQFIDLEPGTVFKNDYLDCAMMKIKMVALARVGSLDIATGEVYLSQIGDLEKVEVICSGKTVAGYLDAYHKNYRTM